MVRVTETELIITIPDASPLDLLESLQMAMIASLQTANEDALEHGAAPIYYTAELLKALLPSYEDYRRLYAKS